MKRVNKTQWWGTGRCSHIWAGQVLVKSDSACGRVVAPSVDTEQKRQGRMTTHTDLRPNWWSWHTFSTLCYFFVKAQGSRDLGVCRRRREDWEEPGKCVPGILGMEWEPQAWEMSLKGKAHVLHLNNPLSHWRGTPYTNNHDHSWKQKRPPQKQCVQLLEDWGLGTNSQCFLSATSPTWYKRVEQDCLESTRFPQGVPAGPGERCLVLNMAYRKQTPTR